MHFFGVLSYGYPMGMLWLSYGINSQLPYNTQYSLLTTLYLINDFIYVYSWRLIICNCF